VVDSLSQNNRPKAPHQSTRETVRTIYETDILTGVSLSQRTGEVDPNIRSRPGRTRGPSNRRSRRRITVNTCIGIASQ